MDKNSKIYVAGHRGLAGSAITKRLQEKGYTCLILRTSKELDLTDPVKTAEFFQKEKPEYVFLAAAKVGGIMANNTYRAQFIYENLQIQTNVIHQSYLHGVKKLIFLGSSCIYPRNAPQPLKEEYLLTGELEYTNEPYAVAKIAGIKMCESYNLQYGTNFISVMPTNLYGPNDNYNLETSHVLPAMLRKMHLGKCLMNDDWQAIRKDLMQHPVKGISPDDEPAKIIAALEKYGIEKKRIVLWGTGTPLREFLHSHDMADACVFIAEKINFSDLAKGKKEIRNTHINIGCGEDISLRDLAGKIKKITGYEGEIVWDPSKPDGTPRKLMDVSRLTRLGWKPSLSLEEGIKSVYELYYR